ncbi:MAG: hypothetical protein KGZ45_00050 [Clostridium sp.]|nr:hypothetical protein [Clostridium sp.]
MKQEKIKEIREIVEQERAKLYLLSSKHGLDSSQVLEQSKIIDSLLLALMALEKESIQQQDDAPPPKKKFTLALTACEKLQKSRRTSKIF